MKTLFLLLSTPVLFAAPSTIDSAHAFAHAPNAGWIHFRPNATDGVAVHLYHLSGKAYGANFGWIDFGDGTPGAGHLYSNAAASDCGVNHDGAGNLSGYAYAANLGWINFGWATSNDPNRARFDVQSGQFHGYAYSANIGWISLGNGSLKTSSMSIADSDLDGIGDEWELAWFGNLTTANQNSDGDQDGSADLAEYLADTLPLDSTNFLQLKIVSATPMLGGIQSLLTWNSQPTRRYEIQTSTTLEVNSWTASQLGELPGTGLPKMEMLTLPGTKRFFRLRPLLPLVAL
jgi:hypothetical protein